MPDVATAHTAEAADVTPDLSARRPEVLRRLLERGVPAETLGMILPGWEPFLAEATAGPESTAR